MPDPAKTAQLLSCCQTFKIIHNLDYLNFDDYLCFNQSSTRSHSLTLHCARSRINSFRYSFFVNIPFLWNSIPYDIVNSTSYVAFKYKLKSFFFLIKPHMQGLCILVFCFWFCVHSQKCACIYFVVYTVLCVVVTGGAPTQACPSVQPYLL